MIFSKKHLQEEIDELYVRIDSLEYNLKVLQSAILAWKELNDKVDIIAELNNLEFVEMKSHLHVQRKEPQNSRD